MKICDLPGGHWNPDFGEHLNRWLLGNPLDAVTCQSSPVTGREERIEMTGTTKQ